LGEYKEYKKGLIAM
jgi:hypothetical protein